MKATELAAKILQMVDDHGDFDCVAMGEHNEFHLIDSVSWSHSETDGYTVELKHPDDAHPEDEIVFVIE